MAPPSAWFDAFVRTGWHRVLPGSVLRLVLVVGMFYDRWSRDSRADGRTVQEAAGLSRSTFRRALKVARSLGLVTAKSGRRQGRFRTYRCLVFTLVEPVPPVPATYGVHRRTRYSESRRLATDAPAGSPVNPAMRHQRAPYNREEARPARRSAPRLATDSAQLVVKSEPVAVGDYLRRQGVPPVFVPHFLDALRAVRAFPVGVMREAAVDDAADDLSRLMQSEGVLWPEVKVADLLRDAVAVLHPLVQAALDLLNAEIIGVRPVS